MKFSELVKQATALLEDSRRVSYRALKREFELDDETLDDLKKELVGVLEVAADKDGDMLVWTGDEGSVIETPRPRAEQPVTTPATRVHCAGVAPSLRFHPKNSSSAKRSHGASKNGSPASSPLT